MNAMPQSPYFMNFPQMAGEDLEPHEDVRNLTALNAFGGAVKGGPTKARFFPALVELAPDAAPLADDRIVERGGKRYVMRDHIGVITTGDRLSAHCEIAQEWHKRVYADHWKAYEQAAELPDYGTPIQELPGIINRDVLMLALAGVQTIEEAAILDETLMRDIGTFAKPIREKARIWLERRDENATASELADLRAEREREATMTRERLDRMQKQLEQMAAENAALQRVVQTGGRGSPQSAVPEGAVLSGTPEAEEMVQRGRVTPLFSNDPMTEGPAEYDATFDAGSPPDED